MKLQPRPKPLRAPVVVAALLAIALAACSNTGSKSGTSSRPAAGGANTDRTTVAFVTHQAPGDTFWDLVRRGAEAAAARDGIDLQYSSDPDAAGQANLVRSAVNNKVAGIAVTLAVPEAMAPAVQAATAEIPVVAVNSGIDAWKAMGVLEYFGQDEEIAGMAAGERLALEGAKNTLCVIHEPGHVGLESRCAGVAKAFTGQTEILYVSGIDAPSVKATMTAKLQQDRSIDRILTLGAPVALTALQAIGEANSYARVATFDTNAAVVQAIKNGTIEWAVDQQPYLQGYLAVDSLSLYLTNKNIIGGGRPTLTGPSFVDESNIDSVAELAAAGTR
ncbi:MAG TPA: substrate-binding domain-containing protein [Mycobacterium sp.]|jgi:simple sugar transport system substrate-binding protein|nr:substrate-binding domain-containing protein [Mycobacterium sp.]